MPYDTVGTLSRLWGVSPKILSDLFHQKKLDQDRCLLVSGRRLIPRDYRPEIRATLVQLGYLKEESALQPA
jgi:hypothetical protein